MLETSVNDALKTKEGLLLGFFVERGWGVSGLRPSFLLGDTVITCKFVVSGELGRDLALSKEIIWEGCRRYLTEEACGRTFLHEVGVVCVSNFTKLGGVPGSSSSRCKVRSRLSARSSLR
jgi:hypothetical protein